MGTGEHARQLVEALRSQGISPALTTLRPDASPEDERLLLAPTRAGTEFDAFNLLCTNADMVPHIAAQLGVDFFSNRYTVGFWAWEVSSFPGRFARAFDYLDEVWVGSRHVRKALEPISPRPLLVIPQPVSLPPEAATAAPPAGLPDGFRFLFAFDYLSIFERKNPLATVEAFTRVFTPHSGAVLIIKCLNSSLAPEAHARLRGCATQYAHVHLIDERLTMSARNGLMNAADCYVSLHRAEGFGYTLAESMWLGKPVIATGYSGNTDFMTSENSYLIDYSMVRIGAGNDPYPADGEWAQPDIDHAAELMRHVFDHPDEARQRGVRAAAEIRRSHGPEAAGRVMVKRLEVLEAAGDRLPIRGDMRAEVVARQARSTDSVRRSVSRLRKIVHRGSREKNSR
jgi:glycosyltransferase involved in cell wall biosynthesis